MTNAMLTDLLQSLGLLGIFLLIGVFLRAKFKIFQKTFIPASVIGGFLLLILGPSVRMSFLFHRPGSIHILCFPEF